MYNPISNTLVIDKRDAHSGDAYGEEIGHYLHSQMKPKNDKREKLTSEFFGYLGRRILKKVAGRKNDLKFKLDESIGTRKETLAKIKEHKKREKRYQEYASKVDLNKLDYDEIYSLPNKEVRDRFFRERPRYKKKKSLKSSLIILALVSLAFVILLLNNKFRGYIILESSNTISGFSLLFIGIIILTVMFIKFSISYLNKKR